MDRGVGGVASVEEIVVIADELSGKIPFDDEFPTGPLKRDFLV